ncbi:MAG: EamA family transporter [Ignavibacteriales bacterium]|nr:EamA family transporter [Ignavibacteriales bacterium]HOJ19342.1 EamA family transporter [Ignavibacteriaceae bacterium]HPO55394.1 EamA family transporter [Ignavibacteriaceae bacterium]
MWVILALLNPVSESFRNVFSKKASLQGADPYLVSWFNNFIPVLVYTPLLLFIDLRFTEEFITVTVISGFINIVAVLLYHRAIAEGNISEVVPMLSFTPLFLLAASPLIINEFPDWHGVTGLLLIVLGSYMLNINLARSGFLSPFKSLLRAKGTRYMFIVAFIWALSSNYDKIGIQQSSPLQYIIFLNLFVFVGITIVLLFLKRLSIPAIIHTNKNVVIVGIFTAFGFFLQMTALSLTLVAYVIALKRMSGMITVIWGYYFFNERNIHEKLVGSVIMFVGVLLILLPF